MKRLLLLLLTTSSLALFGCGPSQEEIDNIATITCNIMGESRNMDAAMRIREINNAREKIGGEPYLEGDDEIKESFAYGLCEMLVKNPDQYASDLSIAKAKREEEDRKREEEDRKREERRREELKIAEEKRAEEEKIARKKRQEDERIARENRIKEKIVAERAEELACGLDKSSSDSAYVEIERPLVANIVNSRKVMQVKVAIMTHYDDRVVANMEKHEFAIRSEMLDVMRKIDENRISEPNFRSDLAEQLKIAVNSVLERYEDFGGVEEVMFTEFVVQ